METETPSPPATLVGLVKDIRVIVVTVAALGLGGSGGWVMADAGVTAAQCDSISRSNLAPVSGRLARQDTAIIQINFRLEVMMTDDQKRRADSLMRAAMRNINYGGFP